MLPIVVLTLVCIDAEALITKRDAVSDPLHHQCGANGAYPRSFLHYAMQRQLTPFSVVNVEPTKVATLLLL